MDFHRTRPARMLCLGAGLTIAATLVGGCSHAHATASDAPLAPSDARAEQTLTSAISAATAFFLGGNSYTGFQEDASLVAPDISWNTDAIAVAGGVSIRDDTAGGIVLVTKSVSGTP